MAPSLEQASRNRKLFNALALTAVLTLGIGVFYPVTSFDFVDLDDPALVTENPYVNRGLTGQAVLWAFTFAEVRGAPAAEGATNVWAPLTFLSHSLDFSLWGADPGRHHLTNLVLHLATTCLVFLCFLRLGEGRTAVAVFVAAVFCIHPMRVESVAWIAERKDVLSGFFFFSSLLLYLAWTHSQPDRSRTAFNARLLYAGSLVAFLASCLSKPAMVVLPGLLILIDIWPLQRFEVRSVRGFLIAQAREKWPFLSAAAGVSGLAVFLQLGGSHRDFMSGHGFTDRLVEMPALILFYLERTAFPANLFPDYPRYPHPFVTYSALALVVLTTFTVLAWTVRKSGPGILFGWCWFLISLFPVLGLIYVGPSFSSDRYTYIAHCGIATSVGAFALHLVNQWPWTRVLALLSGVFLIAWMAMASRDQVEVWRDSATLFRHGNMAQPYSTAAWTNLGVHHMKEGRTGDALECFRSALKLRKDHDVYFNLGLALRANGAKPEEQLDAFRNSIKIYPDYFPALAEMGMMLTDRSLESVYDPGEGCRHLERACEITNYRPAARPRLLVERLLNTYQETGNRNAYSRVMERASSSGFEVVPAQ